MKRFGLALVLLACAMISTGCVSRAIKEGVGVAFGPKGVSVPIQPIAENMAGKYYVFQVEPFADETPSGVPQIVKDTLAPQVQQKMAEFYDSRKILPQTGAESLTIRGSFIYYEDANNTTDQVFGPFEELLARVRLYSGRRLVGEAYCVGRSTESVNKGPEKKAQGLAKAIVNWIATAYPKP